MAFPGGVELPPLGDKGRPHRPYRPPSKYGRLSGSRPLVSLQISGGLHPGNVRTCSSETCS